MSCDDCFKTVHHTGTPLGRTESIAGVPTYIAEPTTTGQKKILFYFSDVFGPFYINSQLLQDWFASNGDHVSFHAAYTIYMNVGYIVLGLDYFMGDRFETLMKQPGFVRETWRNKAVAQAREYTPRWVEEVKKRYGTTDVKYFAVGYCFGAPYVFALANDPTFNLAAGAVAHPSSIYDGATKQLKSDLIENCVAPIAFGCAEIDQAFPVEARRQAEDILVKNKAHYYFQIFSGTTHGFGARGDPADDSQRFGKEECARGFLQWFNRFAA
ncbi:Alpha/Beta hydrolase protein [Butyriboletus roseoflavus]|nr:Alpha/Beta hydrolase protein [Butyriboletus roseoflavus]